MIPLLLAGAVAAMLAGCSGDTPDTPEAPAPAATKPPPATAPSPTAPAPTPEDEDAPPPTAGWTSALLSRNPDSGAPEPRRLTFAGRTWALPDFSYAGYRLGAASLASGIPCNTLVGDSGVDITARLQGAVNSLGQGGGGTVTIPAGRYVVSDSIEVPFDNVSIVGAGSDRTVLNIPASYDPQMDPDEGVFTFGKRTGGWNKAWVDRGPVLAEVTGAIEPGQSYIDVRDASKVDAGDWVIVTQYQWPAFSRQHSGGSWPSYAGFPADPLKANREFSYAYLRQVVSKNGQRLALDAPIPWRLDPADNPVRLRSPDNSIARLHTNVGLAGVSIEFERNDNGPGGRPSGSAVYFEGVRDGWVYDVDIRNFPRNGIYMDHAARITVLQSAVTDAQDKGVGGYGYGIQVKSSQNVLLRRNWVANTRHGYTSRGALTSLLVHSDNDSLASDLEDDTHFAMSQGVLWDAHRLQLGTGMLGIYRGAESGGAHESLGTAVYWNLRGHGTPPGTGKLRLNPASAGWAVVAGASNIGAIEVGRTLADAEPIPANNGLQVATRRDSPGPGSRDQNVLYEGLGRAGLWPPSLYAAQLHARLGGEPAEFMPPCG